MQHYVVGKILTWNNNNFQLKGHSNFVEKNLKFNLEHTEQCSNLELLSLKSAGKSSPAIHLNYKWSIANRGATHLAIQLLISD